jgi:hypothetical protein
MKIDGKLVASFTNDGKAPIGILRVGITLAPNPILGVPSNTDAGLRQIQLPSTCRWPNAKANPQDAEPVQFLPLYLPAKDADASDIFVLKPSEVMIKQFNVTKEDWASRIENTYQGHPFIVMACLSVEVISGHGRDEISKPIGIYPSLSTVEVSLAEQLENRHGLGALMEHRDTRQIDSRFVLLTKRPISFLNIRELKF